MFEYLKRFRENFPNRKFFQLIDKIHDMDNLEDAWNKVKANKGCAGIDKQSISDFQPQRGLHFKELQRAIKRRTYRATPVLRKYIPKSDGKLRPLGIPTVKDRVLQQATKNVIEQVFEMKFMDCSYGFRPEKNAHQAIEQIRNYLQQGFTWIIDADIKSFFDSVDHSLLMSCVAEEISDGKVLGLIEEWLKAGVMAEGNIKETNKGTPQGGVISPLLANVYLHEMDKAITKWVNVRLVRYADDFVIMCKTGWMAKKTMERLKKLLGELKLQLSETKTQIVNSEKEEFEFLGFKFRIRRGKIRITPRDKSIEKFKDSVRQLTRKHQPIKPEQMVGRLNWTVRGWGNYFKIGDVKTVYKELDIWLRMRVRCFIEKKKSGYSCQRISNYVLFSEYKLASLVTLIDSHSL